MIQQKRCRARTPLGSELSTEPIRLEHRTNQIRPCGIGPQELIHSNSDDKLLAMGKAARLEQQSSSHYHMPCSVGGA